MSIFVRLNTLYLIALIFVFQTIENNVEVSEDPDISFIVGNVDIVRYYTSHFFKLRLINSADNDRSGRASFFLLFLVATHIKSNGVDKLWTKILER